MLCEQLHVYMYTIILKLSNAHTSLKLCPLTAWLFFTPERLHLNKLESAGDFNKIESPCHRDAP